MEIQIKKILIIVQTKMEKEKEIFMNYFLSRKVWNIQGAQKSDHHMKSSVTQ